MFINILWLICLPSVYEDSQSAGQPAVGSLMNLRRKYTELFGDPAWHSWTVQTKLHVFLDYMWVKQWEFILASSIHRYCWLLATPSPACLSHLTHVPASIPPPHLPNVQPPFGGLGVWHLVSRWTGLEGWPQYRKKKFLENVLIEMWKCISWGTMVCWNSCNRQV